MPNCKKLFSVLTVLVMISSQLSVGAQNLPNEQIDLKALQAQAKDDMKACQNIWPEGKDILPAVLAVTPLLRKQAVQYAEEVEAAITKPRAVFPYNNEEFLSTAQQKKFREFAQQLREGNYTEATRLMDEIGYREWDFLRKTRGTDLELSNNIDKFLREEIPAASHDLSLGSFFEAADPEMEKLLKPYLKDLRNIDGYNYAAWRTSLEKSPLASKFASKQEFEEFVTLLKNTQTRFIFPDLETNYAMKYITDVRDVLLRNTKRGVKPSSFFMRSVKTTSSFLFRQKNILILTAVAIVGVSVSQQASAKDRNMSQRMQKQFTLFTEANDDDLQTINTHPQTLQTVVEMAEGLRQLRQLMEENPAAFSEVAPETQAKHHARVLKDELRKVSAH